MKTFVLAAALAGTALSGAAVLAQTPPAPMAPGGDRMMRGDTDGDGRISRAEAIAEADARFARMDVNGDGKLSPDEMERRGHRGGGDMPPPPGADAPPPPPLGADAPPPPGRRMQRSDMDGDGAISREEYRAQAMKRFDRLDLNHDGFIDQAETQAMRDRMMQMRERRDGGDTPPPPAPQNPGQ